MASVNPKSESNSPATAAASASASQRADESDLDPAAFLKSVRELSEKREREDAERYRKLEEEIERGRQERAARRAERAKSISPVKSATTSTASLQRIETPPPTAPPASSSLTMDPAMSQGAAEEVPEFRGFSRSGSKTKGSTSQEATPSSTAPARSAPSLARSGTLSWQQRPSSRGAESRPVSVVSLGSNKPADAPSSDSEPSRDQIAASLGARDPSWFRQTADRGVGNAAYRKSKEESAGGDSFVSGRRGLPGMSRTASTEPVVATTPPPAESVGSDNMSRYGSTRESEVSSSQFSADRTSSSSKPDLKTLVAEDAGQEKASPMSERTSNTDGEQSSLGRPPTMSSSQARLTGAAERPASPTKGMGGFVQSAMIRRSESQTKRWSAQPSTAISRNNSAASARSGYGGLAGSHSMPKLEPTPGSRESSKEPNSRPTSSSSNLTNLTTAQGQTGKDGFVKPALPHSRSKSIISSPEDTQTSPPASPSKRWSPNKSTWLESAITKPESPKPAPAARNSQPSWMADIAKAKAQRASGDSTPKPADEESARPVSPSKTPFGQGMLKRSESRDLDLSRSSTPKIGERTGSRSASPTKSSFSRASKDLDISTPGTPKVGDTGSRSASPTKTPFGRGSRDIAAWETESAKTSNLTKTTSSSSITSNPQIVDTVDTKIDDSQVAKEKSTSANAADVKPEKQSEPQSLQPRESPRPSPTKPKPEAPPKPQTDFRSNLRTRAPSGAKQQETPEFLSRFGSLKKTTTQNYVAPDLLKDNILRGKGDLTKTGGPVKTQRRDELKESLLAKKEQWKKEKDDGVVHERKISNPPYTPQKPEALAKRDLLGRSDSIKGAAGPEKSKDATPEALARHKSLRVKPKPEAPMPALEKQKSEPLEALSPAQSKQSTETSKMASKFNPGLAGILARGPPGRSSDPARSESAATSSAPSRGLPSEPLANGPQLQDMRKGRAKGPKRRKADVKDVESEPPAASTSTTPPTTDDAAPILPSTDKSIEPSQMDGLADVAPKSKPRAPPGSSASIMMASLKKTPSASESTATSASTEKLIEPSAPDKLVDTTPKSKPRAPPGSAASVMMGSLKKTPSNESKPSVPAKSPSIVTPKLPAESTAPSIHNKSAETDAVPKTDVPEFKGFTSMKKSTPSWRQFEDNKENTGESSPSVKSAASRWGQPSTSKKTEPPGQIQLPSKKDEEAAMRSAGLLASSPSRPGSSNGLGIKNDSTPSTPLNVPAKPLKSSRAISGQLQEASPNKVSASQDRPLSAFEQRLADIFGSVPKSTAPLSIDTHAAIVTPCHQERVFRTLRKTVQLVGPDGSVKQLPPLEEYTFFEEDVYICTHAYSVGDSAKKTEIFVWTGSSSSHSAADQAHTQAKKLAKENGNGYVHGVRQGVEPPGFLQALGGILVTRRGSHGHASRQYILRGRTHLGQIVFDEVEFGVQSLCSAFAYLISYPVTLQETKVYLWKGSACSTEEVSGGRLAAMGSIDGVDVIEVDDGAEFASFLKIFGQATTKSSIPKASSLSQQKALAPSRFTTRLFRIQLAEIKTGIFSGMFRRPSWGSGSPARRQEEECKAEAIEISPFAQTDLEADCIYALDTYTELHVLVGPMFSSQAEAVRNLLLGQTLLFTSEYAVLAASEEDRPAVPKASILVSGVPQDLKMVFRHWDDGTGLWGTGGLMSGSYEHQRDGVEVLGLNEVLRVVCMA